ncbi:MAG: hypothetical protein QMC95_18265, partial [Desulfitobacteriaceae bacterium]|nr:hypothetical protein [Desulfitobacteriaceae bacterium]
QTDSITAQGLRSRFHYYLYRRFSGEMEVNMENFVRKVANSNLLAGVIDMPETLRNREVEILIFPLENINREDSIDRKPKNARGLLEKYKNKDLQLIENSAWAEAVVDRHENS